MSREEIKVDVLPGWLNLRHAHSTGEIPIDRTQHVAYVRMRGVAAFHGAMSNVGFMPDESTVNQFLPRVPFQVLKPSEPIVGTGNHTVLDYWCWACSDVLENTQRGVFAEFLVASALGVTHERRIGWAGYDIGYETLKIEVKSSAYLQAWNQRKLTNPSFTIGGRRQLDESGIKYEADPRYVADCYVFCLYKDTDPLAAQILDVKGWDFYVVPISRLIRECKTAKTLSLQRLKGFAAPIAFDSLKCCIEDVRLGDLVAATLPESQVPARVNQPEAVKQNARRLRIYLVCRRKTKEHPVIVQAADYTSAHLLARADPTLASFGGDISAFALSTEEERQALLAGAVDLRGLTVIDPGVTSVE